MDQQYTIEISFSKFKNLLNFQRKKKIPSIIITCISKTDVDIYRQIPSNMSLDYLFEVAKSEHLKCTTK